MSCNEEHKQRHILLHKHLDELIADFINFTRKSMRESTIMELSEWSYSQTLEPVTRDEVITELVLGTEASK